MFWKKNKKIPTQIRDENIIPDNSDDDNFNKFKNFNFITKLTGNYKLKIYAHFENEKVCIFNQDYENKFEIDVYAVYFGFECRLKDFINKELKENQNIINNIEKKAERKMLEINSSNSAEILNGILIDVNKANYLTYYIDYEEKVVDKDSEKFKELYDEYIKNDKRK